MKLHIPVVDKRKKRLNRSCSVLTKAGWIRRQSWVKTVMTPVISSLIARYHGAPCCVIFRFIILFSLELTGSSPGRRGRGSLQEVATCRKRWSFLSTEFEFCVSWGLLHTARLQAMKIGPNRYNKQQYTSMWCKLFYSCLATSVSKANSPKDEERINSSWINCSVTLDAIELYLLYSLMLLWGQFGHHHHLLASNEAKAAFSGLAMHFTLCFLAMPKITLGNVEAVLAPLTHLNLSKRCIKQSA